MYHKLLPSFSHTTLNTHLITLGGKLAWPTLRAALHLEAGQNPHEADCMKVQPFLGWGPASTTHYNKIVAGGNFLICKGLRAKKIG
jgi:hypothetical protein